MSYDVAVIGAGIQGVGVAQAAAAAGYSVVIFEKNAPASGTSCKSSKLIHGGLRYLESGQFKLVYECLNERKLLLKNAPDLVELKPFFIPVYKDTSRSALKIQIGLNMYKALTGFDKSGQFKKIPRSDWSALDGLNTNQLKAVFQYWDAQTDDAKLTKAVLRSAQTLGAELFCPAEIVSCEQENKSWNITFNREGGDSHLTAKVVVNASGPWVNGVLNRINPDFEKNPVDLVKGSHIVVPEKTHGGIYYLEAPLDKRAVFVMPWEEQTMIGTTEKAFNGDPDDVQASDEEISYLLETASFYFPKFSQYNKNNLTNSFAGLRVLPGGGDNAFSKARDTIIHEDKLNSPGLISLYGGKLTAYRATAQQVLDKILPSLPSRTAVADTKDLPLS